MRPWFRDDLTACDETVPEKIYRYYYDIGRMDGRREGVFWSVLIGLCLIGVYFLVRKP